MVWFCSVICHKTQGSGYLTAPNSTGAQFEGKALCDLRWDTNLMPYCIHRDLGLGEVKPTLVTPQPANHSLAYPLGITADFLVIVG